ncbi:hypothetical protein GKZ68_21290 (plasmid) [Hymenobacter sp. BRD128]|uniref:hypothetical protein n=1 Tax=Hymenobacter sp. BRD128 TaxID=2675878 RepID=UPI0015662004|nr:hypothetical protein [Hymenobacter sp. BRD128]QKG59214.1 hypothetical protein GKZ68_21290 [Hymenobacter sp. BRD128]
MSILTLTDYLLVVHIFLQNIFAVLAIPSDKIRYAVSHYYPDASAINSARPYLFVHWSASWSGRMLSTLLVCWALNLSVMGQAPAKQWDHTYGGDDVEFAGDMARTTDGGYIIGGQSVSANSGDRSAISRGSGDIWILKLDAAGLKSWDKAFGGSGNEALRTIRQTTDGGYILGGVSTSGISGDKSESNFGDQDVWIVKLDAQGRKQWDHRFGGSGFDAFGALQQTTDGGYLIGCTSASGISGNKTASNLGSNDYWVVKLDANGSKQWEHTYGGSLSDEIYDVVQTADGGYAIGGNSASGISTTKSQPSRGLADYWLLKLDSQGNRQWDKTLGGQVPTYCMLYAKPPMVDMS